MWERVRDQPPGKQCRFLLVYTQLHENTCICDTKTLSFVHCTKMDPARCFGHLHDALWYFILGSLVGFFGTSRMLTPSHLGKKTLTVHHHPSSHIHASVSNGYPPNTTNVPCYKVILSLKLVCEDGYIRDTLNKPSYPWVPRNMGTGIFTYINPYVTMPKKKQPFM